MIALHICLAPAQSASLDQRPVKPGKNCTLLLIPIAASLLLSPVTAQNRVLFIGNSFTIGSGDGRTETVGGVPAIFDALARANDHADPKTVKRAVSGMDFEFHAGNTITQNAISSEQWTHVILQNLSAEPTHLARGSIQDHTTFGTQLYHQIIANNVTTQVILYETFSRSEAHALITASSGPNSFASTAEFQGEIRANYAALAESLTTANPNNPPVQVAPVGSAWENAGGLLPKHSQGFANLHSSDEAHGNDNGYYLAAAVFYATIYGRSPEGLSDSAEIQALHLNLTEDAQTLERIASETVGTSSFEAGQALLIDFGSTQGITEGSDDSARTWNNVTPETGGADDAELSGLRLKSGKETDVTFAMLNRFNGANKRGAIGGDSFPSDATRDSLFGNSEMFNGLSHVFPSFKLMALNSRLAYDLTFYASRSGVHDNRETRYTVTGALETATSLDAANNQNEIAHLQNVAPTADGEITITLTPGDNNDNGNHFTYLGLLQITAGGTAIEEDTHPPQIESTKVNGAMITIEFNEAVEVGTAESVDNYTITTDGDPVALDGAAELQADAKTVIIELGATFVGPYTLTIASVSDLAGNVIAANSSITGVAPDPYARVFLFDFGGDGMFIENDDVGNSWNNVSHGVADSNTGKLSGIVDTSGALTDMSLAMIRRFNGVNQSGTRDHAGFPSKATRDSFYANTEPFSGLRDVFPCFQLTDLMPSVVYTFTMYASRMEAAESRETRYTITGANKLSDVLDPSNNVANTVTIEGIIPDTKGTITFSITPTENNTNRNHFTYLGLLKIETAPTLRSERIGFRITWLERDDEGITLTWTSHANTTYSIESSNDLRSWNELEDGIAASGETTTFKDHSASDSNVSFYRVRRE